ncbi:MAG: hypothetical protein IJ030_03155 [Oscillospiraceae bacterium]|nr:hypothetical protein [Oscillospiraceae bacterium]MBQ8881157.1 hypothetical protein [Oscillospiraceae bacterium]
MVDYEFYVNDYLGSAIPEKAFSGVAAQARHWLGCFKSSYRVESSGVEAEKLAICAMAESLWNRRSQGLVSPNTSARNGSEKQTLCRELYEKASIYLDIYRGVKQ